MRRDSYFFVIILMDKLRLQGDFMKKLKLFIKLKKERKKLNNLIDEALQNGTPLSQTQAIMEQSQKVNAIVETIQNEISRKPNKE